MWQGGVPLQQVEDGLDFSADDPGLVLVLAEYRVQMKRNLRQKSLFRAESNLFAVRERKCVSAVRERGSESAVRERECERAALAVREREFEMAQRQLPDQADRGDETDVAAVAAE